MKKTRFKKVDEMKKTVKRTSRKTRSFVDKSASRQDPIIQKGTVRKRKPSSGIRIRKQRMGRAQQVPISRIPRESPGAIPNSIGRRPDSNQGGSINLRSLVSKYRKLLLFAGKSVFVMLVVFFVGEIQQKTEITLRPHVEPIDFNTTVVSLRNPGVGQLGFDIIALDDQVSIPVDASGVRSVQEYASGAVTLYNNYSQEPQRLLPNTRLESAGGKIFLLGDKEVIIPGKSGTGPGTVSAQVYAQESGSSYNIDLTDFTIPGFSELGLVEKYNNIYAVSEERFSGGYVGEENYVTQAELEIKKEEAQRLLEERLRLRIEKEKTDSVVLVQEAIDFEFDSPETIFEDNDQGYLIQTGKIIAAVISVDNIISYISDVYTLQGGESVSIKNMESLNISYSGDAIDLRNNNELILSLNGSLLVRSILDHEDVKKYFAGLHTEDIIPVTEDYLLIDKLDIKIQPPWRNTIHGDINLISIKDLFLE